MIIPLICAIAAAVDLELVASQSLEANYVGYSPDPLARSEAGARGELARFKDSKGRNFTVILSQSNVFSGTPKRWQYADTDTYVVCRYSAEGVMDRTQLLTKHDFGQPKNKWHFENSAEAKLVDGTYVGKWVTERPATKPIVRPLRIPNWDVQKPFYSVTEANFLFNKRPGKGPFSVASFISGFSGSMYELNLEPGTVKNSFQSEAVPAQVVALVNARPEKRTFGGAFDKRGNQYDSTVPNFDQSSFSTGSTIRSPNANLTSWSASRIVAKGDVSSDNLDKMRSLIPAEWTER